MSSNDHGELDAQLRGESDRAGTHTHFHAGHELQTIRHACRGKTAGMGSAESFVQARGRAGRQESLRSHSGSEVSDTLGTAK